MTPQQFRAAQHKLDLSDPAFARMLGVSEIQIRRLKVEDASLPSHRAVNGTVERLIRAYLDGYRPKDWPK